MTWTPQPRRYEVDYHRSLIRHDTNHWRLRTWGDGHWCGSNGHASHYPSEQEAIAAGECWNATGIPTSEQSTPVPAIAAADRKEAA